ncbi:hypothetical protein NC652_015052 [Populus alba x Populus x berolinensis]|nr:hypothetical protein NC652_015052 [Populus alba x Populus x berolinensis]
MVLKKEGGLLFICLFSSPPPLLLTVSEKGLRNTLCSSSLPPPLVKFLPILLSPNLPRLSENLDEKERCRDRRQE